MEIMFSNIDDGDLVRCSDLYVASFHEFPWNEEWTPNNTFEKPSDFLALPKAVAIKKISIDDTCGFLFEEVQRWNGATPYCLKETCVSKAIQREKVGTALTMTLEEMLRESGV
jgi:hypothetical protein